MEKVGIRNQKDLFGTYIYFERIINNINRLKANKSIRIYKRDVKGHISKNKRRLRENIFLEFVCI